MPFIDFLSLPNQKQAIVRKILFDAKILKRKTNVATQ
jgi:hypothetical protein